MKFYSSFISALFISIILCTPSLGQFEHWQVLNSGTTSNLYAVAAPTNDVVYVAGDNGLVKKSVDGGTTWTDLSFGSNQNLYSINFINENIGVAVGNNRTVRRTTDGGSTWTNVAPTGLPNNFHFRNVEFVNEQIGYMSGGVSGTQGKMFKTTNGGATWTALNFTSSDVIGGFSLKSADVIYYCNYDGQVFRSVDGGETWSIVTHLMNALIGGVGFSEDGEYGVAIGENGILYQTSNGGDTWVIESAGVNDYLFSIIFYDGNKAFVAGGMVQQNTSKLLYTSDGGINWETYNPGLSRLTQLAFASPYVGYVVGIGGALMKYYDPKVYIEEPNNVTDITAVIYPNPTRSVINLELVPDYEVYTVSIMDISGKLLSQYQFNNLGKLEIDIAELSVGTYLLGVLENRSGKSMVQRFVKE